MIAAAQHFIYTGGKDIPREATHVSIHDSVTVIPKETFFRHPNIVELICHAGVKRIESYALLRCPCLERVIIPGVEVVEHAAFSRCEAVTDIDCPKLEIIGGLAFNGCESLRGIDLPSIRVVEHEAFGNCVAIKYVKFGKNLESVGEAAFWQSPSLERITVPLKNGWITHNDTFQGCKSLSYVDLVEGAVLNDTIDALLLEEWRNDIREEISSINRILPDVPTGFYDFEDDYGEVGYTAKVIREWTRRVLLKIDDYKVQHRRLLDEISSAFQHALPKDILMNNVFTFLWPSHTSLFGGTRIEGEGESQKRLSSSLSQLILSKTKASCR